MGQYKDVGEIALWPNKEAQGKQPIVVGHVEIDGTKYQLGLWKSTSDNPKAPTYWGKVTVKEEDHRPQANSQSPSTPRLDFEDDDVPF